MNRGTNGGDSRRPIAILGSGGHAKVVLDVVRACGLATLGWVGSPQVGQSDAGWRGLAHLGDDDALYQHGPQSASLALGMGDVGVRLRLWQRFSAAGFAFPAIFHPQAWIASSATTGHGVQVMAGAVIQADSFVGPATIVNTGAQIDHDCHIGACCHLAPGVILCGGVIVEDSVLVGAGSILLPGARVGRGMTIRAGSVINAGGGTVARGG